MLRGPILFGNMVSSADPLAFCMGLALMSIGLCPQVFWMQMHTLLIIIIILRGDDKSLKRVGPPSHSFSTCGEGGGVILSTSKFTMWEGARHTRSKSTGKPR